MNSEVINSTAGNHELLVEQVKRIYSTVVLMIFTNLASASAVSFILWNEVPPQVLIIWISIMLIVLCWRFFLYRQYKKNYQPESTRRFANYYAIGTGLTGILWGFAGAMMLVPQEPSHQFFILAIVGGLAAGSVNSATAYLPAFLAYTPISMLPASAVLLISGGSNTLLGIMTLVFVFSVSYIGVTVHRSYIDSLKLRFENLELVEQLKEQKYEAEQANIAKSKFLAAASHDLRQPLHALSLFTSVLDEATDSPKRHRVAAQIKASVEALHNLFNALLDISRLDAGVIEVVKNSFYLQPLLDKLSNDFHPLAKEKGLHFGYPTCTYAVHSDPTLLERILRNYISNALRYTHNGEVTVTCIANGKDITINVSDTGLGIAKEDQQIIFAEFHQLSNPERDRSKGLGLGLAIVKRTAKLLGHPINVKSQPGKGSVFSIKVPQAHSVEENKSENTDTLQDTQRATNELIIIVDDEASIREGMESLLTQWGYQVICAVGKEETLNLLRQQSRTPDGIIADYRLREHETGIEVIRAIHTEYKKSIPALIITGDTSVDDLREVNSSGFEVLHKPVAPIKLRAFLRHIQLQTA